MQERVWSKGNPLTLLGMLIGAAIMENSMKIPLKARNNSIIYPSNPTTGYIPEKTTILKDTCIPSLLQKYLQ